jgi:hypothetical protein
VMLELDCNVKQRSLMLCCGNRETLELDLL